MGLESNALLTENGRIVLPNVSSLRGIELLQVTGKIFVFISKLNYCRK